MLAHADRPAHIETLISGVDRYNPSNVHLLEDYLQQQLANDHQFNPAILSPPATLSILFLSLVHAPFSPDFSLAWALLSDSFVVGAALPPAAPDSDDDDDEEDSAAAARPAEPRGEKQTAARLFELSSLLQARKLRAFWTLYRTGRPDAEREDEVRARMEGLAAATKGAEQRVRICVAQEVERSFRSLDRKTLEGFLGAQEAAQVDELAKARGWTVRDGEVLLPANDSNTPKAQVTHERIEIEQLTRLLGRTQA
ncbi:hypothetical protein JCM8202v2_005086 [Rhodotorula sphaerocarpa]